MAAEAPATEYAERDRHQLRTLVLAVAILAGVLASVIFTINAAAWLNQFGFLHFPLGFYLLAQGLLVLMVAACFWFIRLQERIDRARVYSGELV